MTKLQTARQRAGFTQTELAKLADIPLKTLQAYEQGQRDISKAAIRTIYNLAAILRCNINDIV